MATTVYIGDDINNPLFAFDDDNVLSLVTHIAVNFMPQELTADTADIKVEYNGESDIQKLDWATMVSIYNDSQLVGKFYVTNVKKVSKTQYEISATSVVGLLEYETFYGQKYAGRKFNILIGDILLTNSFPFCRFYNTIHRGLYEDNVDVSSGNRFYASKIQSSVNNYPMNSKTEVHLKLNKILLNDLISTYYQGKTNVRICLFGQCVFQQYDELDTAEAADLRNGRYGLYMDVSRETLEDEWPDFGEVFFAYEGNVFSLGTPTEPTDYEIVVSPSDGTAVINDTTYNITCNYPSKTVVGLAWCCGGVIAGDNGSGRVSTWLYPVGCDIEYGKYRLWNSNGEKLVDLIYTEDPKTRIFRTENIPAAIVSGDIGFAKYDREAIIYDGGADEWAYRCYNTISYGSGVDQIGVYGWIPTCTKREALHQLLLATGVIMKKDDDGNIIFTSPSVGDAVTLSSDKIYIDGSLEKLENTNRIEVTEHVFELGEQEESEIVFENSNQRSGIFVAMFQKQPVSGSVINGLSVLTYNANAALVAGGVGTITGIPNRHTETILHRDIADRKDGKTISVNDCTLISLPNSETVLDRLESYYGSAYKVENSIVLGDERIGNLYSFMSPFREMVTGYLSKISSTFSKITKAACEFICGYNPPQIGQDFTNYTVISGSGNWNVPDKVFTKENPRIRIVLIGGGQGGYSGYAGEDGETAKLGPTSTSPAKGGATGKPGSGGKIYTVDIPNPARSYYISAGEGGEGGAISYSHDVSNPGQVGGDTTFSDGTTTYSSASGESSENGVTNFFSGKKYAKQIVYYADGGAGGYIKEGQLDVYMPPEEVRLGLVKGEYVWYNNSYYYNYGGNHGETIGGTGIAYGGCGGGAALTMEPGTVSGGNGADATRSGSYYRTGNGGNGANATFVPLPALSINSYYYGYGGQGGAGGGGGGSSGSGSAGVNVGTGGKGGYGGVGGKGGNGCIIIYY